LPGLMWIIVRLCRPLLHTIPAVLFIVRKIPAIGLADRFP